MKRTDPGVAERGMKKALLQSAEGVAVGSAEDMLLPQVREWFRGKYGKRRTEELQFVIVPSPGGDVAVVPLESYDAVCRPDAVPDRQIEWWGATLGITVEWSDGGDPHLSIGAGIDL